MAHAFPSVVGMAMDLSNHCQVYCMTLLDRQPSYSLSRHTRALFNLSWTLKDTISFQPIDMRRGALVVSKAYAELLASLETSFGARSLWWPQMSLLDLCGFGFEVFPLSPKTFTLLFVASL